MPGFGIAAKKNRRASNCGVRMAATRAFCI